MGSWKPRDHIFARMSRRVDRLSDRRFALLSFLPGGILIGIFLIPPIIAVLVLSFMRIELIRDGHQGFIGLSNYTTRLPRDEEFLAAVPRTITLALGVVLLTVPLALACAMLMNRKSRLSWLIGLAVLLPWAVAPVVTGMYWKFIFNSQYGLATSAANAVGLAEGQVRWLDTPASAMTIAVIATAWRMVPLMALLILGALKAIPDSLYRAAKMDGAGTGASFGLITLPAIAPTLLVVGVTSVVFSLQSIDILFTLTGGGPGRSTTVMTWYLYETAIGQLSFGYSAALALVLLLVIALCSSLVLIMRSRRAPRAEPMDANDSTILKRLIETDELTALADSSARLWNDGGKVQRRIRLPAWMGSVASGAGAIVLLTWLVGPVLWIVVASVQPEASVTSLPLSLSADLRIDNYTYIISQPSWQHAVFVSLQVVIFVTILTIMICAIASYPLSRYRVPGGKYIIGGLIVTQMVPAIVLVIPLLLMFRYIGLKDTVAALVLVNVAFWIPLIVWLLRNVFTGVPRSLESAGRMDGASRLGSLFRVVMPAASPGILATAILVIVGTWNEFLFAVILGDRRAVTVTRIVGFIGQSTAGPDGPPPVTVLAAAGILAVLPCLLLVGFFYRQLVAGLSTGQLKA